MNSAAVMQISEGVVLIFLVFIRPSFSQFFFFFSFFIYFRFGQLFHVVRGINVLCRLKFKRANRVGVLC